MDVPETASPAADHTTPRRPPVRWRKDLLFFVIAATIIALDQFTKALVRQNLGFGQQWPEDPILGVRLIYVVNSGAAFGILQGQTPFLIVTSFVGLIAIVLYYVYPPMEHGIIRVALGMQLGGAVGNLIDRIRVGEVTDFVAVGRFPVFNVADSSITISIIAVLIFFALQESEEDRKKPGLPADAGTTPARDD